MASRRHRACTFTRVGPGNDGRLSDELHHSTSPVVPARPLIGGPLLARPDEYECESVCPTACSRRHSAAAGDCALSAHTSDCKISFVVQNPALRIGETANPQVG